MFLAEDLFGAVSGVYLSGVLFGGTRAPKRRRATLWARAVSLSGWSAAHWDYRRAGRSTPRNDSGSWYTVVRQRRGALLALRQGMI